MAGTVPHSAAPPLTGATGAAAAGNRIPAALAANSVRLGAVADRLSMYFKGTIRNDSSQLFQLCFALARGIDYALSNDDIPRTAQSLPSIIKQVFLLRNDTSLQSAVTVLMISAKNACRNGWFCSTDADELLRMADVLCSSFCMEVSATAEAGNALDTISKIMSRFYPKLKLCRLVVSFEAKPGYDILMADFHIERKLPPQERIMLFVVQTDNLETSSCIISPSQVSFLVNGKGVERRTNVSQDSGPQFPTDITKMLKYGTNIIQAVGYFSGNYLITIAFVGSITSANAPVLKDYVQPNVSALPSDSEVIEGPSRITLNCPISFKRIKTPIKGHLCKHHQCFDYENFMDMNSRKPTWRCPCCNQPSSFVDLRIDQNMVKILGEVGEDICDIVIFADGSWKVAIEHKGNTDKLHSGTHAGRQDVDMECQSNMSTGTLLDAVDLTMEEDATNSRVNGYADRIDTITFETEDRKPFQSIQGFPVSLFSSEPPHSNCTNATAQSAAYQIGGDIHARVLSPSSASNGSLVPARSDGRAHQLSGSMLPSAVMAPIITDAVSPALNLEHMSGSEFCQPTTSFQQESQVWQPVDRMQRSSIMSSQTGRPPIPRYVNRSPFAIQALPALAQAPSSSRRIRTDVLSAAHIIPSSSVSYQPIHSDGSNEVSCDTEMLEVPMASEIPGKQNRDHHDLLQVRNPAVQQIVGLPAPNINGLRVPSDPERHGAYRAPVQPISDDQNPHNQLPNPRMHHTMSKAPNILPQSSRVLQMQTSQNTIGSSSASLANRCDPLLAANLTAAHAIRLQAGPVNSRFSWMESSNTGQRAVENLRLSGSDSLQTTVVLPTATRIDNFPELPPEQNWRPTGRMRGSLTGNAYSAALNQYMVSPTQPVTTRPPAPLVSSTTDSSPMLVANNHSAREP